jgi:signal transduction histidine kinase
MTPLPWPDQAAHSRIVRRSRDIGSATAVVMAAISPLLHFGYPFALLNLLVAGLTWTILTVASRTGRFDLCYILTCITVFLLTYPAEFVTGGTNHGPMPFFFVFALVVSAFMVQGWRFVLIAAAELTDYTVVWLLTAPSTVADAHDIGGNQDLFVAQLLGCLAAGLSLAIGMQLLLRSYLKENQRVKQQNETLARSSKDKDTFLAVVAHELNTPLAIMSAHAEEGRDSLTLDPAHHDWDKAAKNMAAITAESQRLGKMVTELLDTVRINDGTLELHLHREDLSEIIQQVMTTCAPMCAKRGNRLTLERGGASPVVLADRARLMRVFLNLIANANRHTDHGSITVSVHTAEGYAEVHIADTGEGMDQATLDRIFNRGGAGQPGGGVLALPPAGTDWHGLGLGLRIARHIVRRHGGELSLTSTIGQGTVARFTIPLGN